MAPQTPRPKQTAPNSNPTKSDSGIAVSLLSRAHSPTTASTIFAEKIKTRPLYLKPTEPDSNTANAQQARRRARQRALESRKKKLKPKPLSSRQKRALCLYDIPKAAQRYSIYEPLHKMWIGYIQEVLGEKCTPVTAATAAKLCSADFHGAEVEVVRSRCVGRVGTKGLVVRDSKFVLEVVTKKDQVKVIPKEHTMFRFTVPPPGSAAGDEKVADLVFELHGDQFIYRATDRANRKFKSHFQPYL